jgi:hypothetical protein
MSKSIMINKIKSGKYFITRLSDTEYCISSGYGNNMTFKSITVSRALEWLDLGAELIDLR